MLILALLWVCLLGLVVLLPLAVRNHLQAAEWDSIARHHELMAALDPEVKRA